MGNTVAFKPFVELGGELVFFIVEVAMLEVRAEILYPLHDPRDRDVRADRPLHSGGE